MTTPRPTKTPETPLMHSVAETEELTRLSARSIWRLIAAQELETVRCGRAVRITRASIDAFIARGGTAAR